MNTPYWAPPALLSGAFLIIQADLNTKVDNTIDSLLYAALVSFLVGNMGLIVSILISGGHLMYFSYHRYTALLKQLEHIGFRQTFYFEVPYTKKDGMVEQHTILRCSCLD